MCHLAIPIQVAQRHQGHSLGNDENKRFLVKSQTSQIPCTFRMYRRQIPKAKFLVCKLNSATYCLHFFVQISDPLCMSLRVLNCTVRNIVTTPELGFGEGEMCSYASGTWSSARNGATAQLFLSMSLYDHQHHFQILSHVNNFPWTLNKLHQYAICISFTPNVYLKTYITTFTNEVDISYISWLSSILFNSTSMVTNQILCLTHR